jgi:hypothetical protein
MPGARPVFRSCTQAYLLPAHASEDAFLSHWSGSKGRVAEASRARHDRSLSKNPRALTAQVGRLDVSSNPFRLEWAMDERAPFDELQRGMMGAENPTYW